MDKKPKYMLYGIFLLVIVIFILVLTLNLGKPDHQLSKGFHVTINGNVYFSGDSFDKGGKPYGVKIYHNYYNLNNLCEANDISYGKIKWSDDNLIGNYSLTFWTPIEEEIIITPSCRGCFHERVYVSAENNVKNVNLNWSTVECREKRPRYEEPEPAFDKAIELLDGVDDSLSERTFDKNTSDLIKKDISEGRGKIKERSYSPNKNVSLFYAYYAILYAWKANFKIALYDIKMCISDIETLIEEHNDSCYIYPYEPYTNYVSMNSSYNTLSGLIEHSHSRRYGEEMLDDVIDAVDGVHNDRDRIDNVVHKCEETRTLFAKSLEHQETYCERRKISLGFINWILAIIFLGIGLILGKYGPRWN